MSFTDPSVDDVQPEEGQGEVSTSDAPYAEYLNQIPEQLRGDVEPVFKQWDSNVGRKFQEHADYRKQWERYEPTGVNKYEPDAVAWAMEFYDAHQNNPQAVVEYVQQYAQERGVPFGTPEPEQPQQFDEFGFQDPAQLQSLIDQATGPLKQQLEQMQSHIEQQQHQQQEQEAKQFIEQQISTIEQKHGKLDEDQRMVLYKFAGAYADSDPDNAIARGYKDMTDFANGIEKRSLQAKVGNPSPAEGGGVPDTSPERITSLNDARLQETATQWMRNNR